MSEADNLRAGNARLHEQIAQAKENYEKGHAVLVASHRDYLWKSTLGMSAILAAVMWVSHEIGLGRPDHLVDDVVLTALAGACVGYILGKALNVKIPD
jgi:putative effector of murein hydrolase